MSPGETHSGAFARALRSQSGGYVVAGVLCVALALVLGVVKTADGSIVRTGFDGFGLFIVTPVIILFPAILTAITVGPLYARVSNRFLLATVSRAPLRETIDLRLSAIAFVAFCFGFVYVLAPFVFTQSPAGVLANFVIDPQTYGLTAAEAHAEIAQSTTYAEAFVVSPVLYILLYGSIVGVGSAALAIGGAGLVVLLPSPRFGVVIPTLFYVAHTVLASILGAPEFGIMFGLFPFGLTHQPAWVGLSSIGLVVGLAALVVVALHRRIDRGLAL